MSHWFGQTDLMFDVHLFEDCCTVVGDGDVAVRRHHHLVQPFWTQRRPQSIGHSPGSHDVALKKTQMSNMCALFLLQLFVEPHLDGIFASQSVLVLLVAQDQKGPAVLVEGQATDGGHGCSWAPGLG